VETFPLTVDGQPSTFADIYVKLRDAKILKMPGWLMGSKATFETDAGEVTVTGEYFVIKMLIDLIDLHREGVEPHRATWFYYEHDWSCDADETYVFFVVHDGKFVREAFSCMHVYPQVLTKMKVDDKPIWHSEPYGQQAWEMYWYRKFYAETPTGQIMVLRPDEPILYHYERAAHDVKGDVQFVTLIKIYKLLWVTLPLLVAMAFPKLWPYMAVLAVILTADLLWASWATRKTGR
jgi:hypothetical protein